MANWKFVPRDWGDGGDESGTGARPGRLGYWKKTEESGADIVSGETAPKNLGEIASGKYRGFLYGTNDGKFFVDTQNPNLSNGGLMPIPEMEADPTLADKWTQGKASAQAQSDASTAKLNNLITTGVLLAAGGGMAYGSGLFGGAAGAGTTAAAGATDLGLGGYTAGQVAGTSGIGLEAAGGAAAAASTGSASTGAAGGGGLSVPAAGGGTLTAGGVTGGTGAALPVAGLAGKVGGAAAGWTTGEIIGAAGLAVSAGSLAMKLGGGSEIKTSSVNLPPLTQDEQDFIDLNKQLAQKQLEAIERQTAVQTEADSLILAQLKREQAQSQAYDAVNTPEKIQADAARQRRIDELSLSTMENEAARAERLGPIQEEITNIQLEALRRGGKATPEQLAAIKEYADAGIAAGTFDIDAATSRGIGLIADELANSRGLRLSDSPMTGEAALLAREGEVQKGGLIRDMRAGQAKAALDYPLAVQQVQSASAGGIQSAAQAATQFQAQLRDRAYQNRLAMTGQAQGGGLGLSSISGGSSGLNALTQRATSSGTSSAFGERGIGLQDIGTLAQGLGTAGATAYKYGLFR